MMRGNVTATECDSFEFCVNEKGGYFEHKLRHFNSSVTQYYSCWRMSNSWLLLFISRWIMVWNKAVFCLEVLIYKCLQICRHNYVVSRS